MADAATMAQHRRTASGSSLVGRNSIDVNATSAAAVIASSSSPIAQDARVSYLDVSALSPSEYAVYPQWLATIKPARSGEPDHVEEQDALRFLRDECGVGVHEEIRILSLFERFPLGLLPGHFFALLRLAAWVQRGEVPSKALLFTQTLPPRIGMQSGAPVQPPPQHATAIGSSSRGQRNSLPPASSGLSTSPRNSRSVPPPPAGMHSGMQAPLVPISAAALGDHRSSSQHAIKYSAAIAPPVPDDSHKPANPFRPASGVAHATVPQIQIVHAAPALPHHQQPEQIQQPTGTAILGFDPAPNPFKQSKPKLVKPTPIVANANTQVLGRPSTAAPAVDPFKSGQSVSSHGDSPVSGRSLANASPPLPNLPSAELRPPPLPPRHISPLIQASLNARSQVRRQREALPPKTFTVLQSTQQRHVVEKQPRLLTGQAAPPPPAMPPVKRRSVPDTRLSASSATGGAGGAGEGAPSTSKASEHVPDRRSGPLPPTIAPKASYGGHKSKTGVPAWLQEQEVMQRSSMLDHHNEPTAPPADGGHVTAVPHSRRKKRTTSAAQRIQFLDDESDSSDDDDHVAEREDTLSEQARSAASIDRNNPFFRHGRDHERHVDMKETLSKLAVENAVAKAEHESRMSVRASSESSTTKAGEGADKRPLGRSKTLRESASRGSLLPPAVPPRKRGEALPATLHAGTYPGFGRPVRVDGPTVGGLRQNPTSRKAEVGLPPHVLAERERMERERMERSATAPPVHDANGNVVPPPPPRRRTASTNSQISASDGNTPQSPSDELSQPSYPIMKSDMKHSEEDAYDSLGDRQSWFARMTDRIKAGGGLTTNDIGSGATDDDAELQNDEPEVDEQYLREQRQLHRQQQRQQRSASTIEPIREESEASLGGGIGDRRIPTGAPTHPSLSQRRATDSVRRSMSGAGGLAGLVRRSSLLARNSYAAEDVIASDTDEDGESTPRREKEFNTPRPSSGARAPDVDAIQSRQQDGWQQLS